MTAPIDVTFSQGTTITSDWLNGVNDSINNATSSITGSTTRTITNKLSDVVSVKDFGAVGDGITDDTSAFISANTVGGLVLIPKADAYVLGTPVLTTKAAWLPDPSMPWDVITDGGNLDLRRGNTTGGTKGANIWRFSDRMFVGEAASKFAGNSQSGDAGTSWLSALETYAGYLAVNAKFLVTNDSGDVPYGIVAAVKTSNPNNHSIGVGSHVVTDAVSKIGWGFIAELQREANTSYAYGLEVAAKNKGNNAVMTPNIIPAGVYGLWLAGGGDNAFGGKPSAPSTAAIVVLKNDHTWNTGIVFTKESLTSGEAIAMSSEGIGGAHTIRWYNAAGNTVFNIKASTSSDTEQWTLERGNAGVTIVAEGASILTLGKAAAAVNGFTLFGAAAGGAPNLAASGSDTNIDLRLSGKGTGVLRFGTWTSNADVAVNGYITIKDAGGTTRKLATIA